MKKAVSILLLLVLLASAFPAFAKTDANSGDDRVNRGQAKQIANQIYIVEMSDMPVVSYRGGIPGLKATAPKKGQKIDPLSSEVVTYVAYLDGKHNEALNKVGGKKVYDYHFSFNGFAAELSEDQAAAMAAQKGVVAVTKDEARSLDTSSTPAFLGLNAPGGLWDQLGGVTKAGEGIIIGIVDGGIWPESLSFSDRIGLNGNATKDGKLDYQQIPGWHGKCVPGEAFTASNCNQKLIGAQYFNAGWGGNAGIDATLPWEYNSPRDYGGHGTHTASTAGGNANVPATGDASVFGSISGIAPRARIAAYKVCWQTPAGGSCVSSDSVAAIDQAVADGVDVINFSISGSQTNFRDPVEIAFLFAADAGVFVATSAGNSGPSSSTVAHPGPWLTTVAAGTHNRDGRGSVTLGNNITYNGASAATPVGPVPLIDAEAAGLDGADPTQLRLCYGAADGTVVLDPAKVAGKIVICDRGVTARINKSLAVKQAGGVGMIMVNTSINSINADLHFVPTVHLQSTDRAAVKAYATTPGATATINQSTLIYDAPAPFTASFSSRGPLRASGDLLKPDLMAPGQDVLAAVAPPGNFDRSFDLYSGTSMSSPHVAGLAALLKDLHPDWSPAMVKSALMTTGYDVLDTSISIPTRIFRQGAGHVQPNKAADPGLVFDNGFKEWLGFMCGTGQLPVTTCAFYGAAVIDPSNLNVASIAIGDLPGSQTVQRTVTNVGGKETYSFSFSGTGFSATANPDSFTLNPGEKKTVNITFTRTDGALNTYSGGQITWAGDKGHSVRIPAVVRPVALAAPAQVSGNGAQLTYNVTFGYTGAFAAAARGLVPATTFEGTVADDPTDTFSPTGPGVAAFNVTVPAGTTYARFSLFDEFTDGVDDLDLYVFLNDSQVGGSGSGTSAEEVNLANPTAGTYTVYVHGWQTDGPDANFTLFTWALGSTAAGNMTVTAPAAATIGGTGTINLTFSGLTSGVKYLGSVAYSGITGLPAPTIVRVDVP